MAEMGTQQKRAEMDRTTIIVSAVVGSVGLLGAILGFAAEGAGDPSSGTAIWLGTGTSIFLLGGQITVSVAGSCFGCCCKKPGAIPPSENKQIVGIVCGIFSWILAAIALVLLTIAPLTKAAGTYASGGVLTLIATALCITSFIMLRNQPVDAGKVQVQPRDFGQQPLPVGIPTEESLNNKPMPVTNAYMVHPPSHTTAVADMPNKPPHPPTVVAVGEQLPRPQVYPVHHQPPQQQTYPVQTQESGEEPLLAGQFTPSQQQPLPPHQVVYVMQQPPQPRQHTVPSHQVCGDIPIPPTPAARTIPQGIAIDEANTRLQPGITKQDLIKTGVNIGTRVLVEAVKQSLAPDNADPAGMAGGILLSMSTGAIGGGGGEAGDTDCGDAGY